MPKAIDLSGRSFGRLTARTPAVAASGRRGWLCRCDCGGTKIVETTKLTRSVVRSCGCLERDNRLACEYMPAAPVAYRCPGCGRQLAGHPNRRYCSPRCKARIARGWGQPRHCRACGRLFRLRPGHSRKREHCSPECRRILRAKYMYRRNRPEIMLAELQGRLDRDDKPQTR